MSTIKSSNEHLTLNADGSGNDIKFQSNGTEVASISDGGVITATTFSGAATDSTKLPLAGGTMTGNIVSGDNVKATYGASADLEIYHDGSDSKIVDKGTGNMLILTNGNFYVQNEGGSETIIRGDVDGSVELYYDNSKKLETTSTGVSVTGYLFGPTNIGLDTTDKIQFSDGSNINFVVNGGDEMRLMANGDLHVDGDVIAYSTTISDERLKDNIEVVDGALDKVKELKGVTFNRKQDGQKSAGVIAQDVEKVLPEAVKRKALPLHTGDDELFKTVQYDALHALLIEAVKELSEKVEKLENK